jgi:uncharacterized protein YutE (UPF0331/DUF86 family)
MSPGHIDAQLVRRHLLALDTAVANLRRHAGRPLEALTDDLDEAWAVERGLLVCIQNVLDVATHLAAAAGRDSPDYATAIEQLGALGALPAPFAARLRGIAGFRNLLVHGYLALDLARVHQLLNLSLADFDEFALCIHTSLTAEEREADLTAPPGAGPASGRAARTRSRARSPRRPRK